MAMAGKTLRKKGFKTSVENAMKTVNNRKQNTKYEEQFVCERVASSMINKKAR